MTKTSLSALLLLPLCASLAAQAPPGDASADPAPRMDGAAMPVRELTAFKDGHAYVLRDAPLGDGRTVVLDELPEPLLGTFWPFATGGAELVSARAGRDEVTVQRPAESLLDLAEANVGRVVSLDVGGELGMRLEGRMVGVRRPDGGPGMLLLEHNGGTRVVPITRVLDLQVRGKFRGDVDREEQRRRLTLKVRGGGEGGRVGVAYVQRGFRWIPSYRVELGDDGVAKVRLQATMVNDLVDLDDATVNLVVGVPKFAFEGMVDPIALQEQTAQVAGAPVWQRQTQFFSNALSNSLMTQVPAMAGGGAAQPADPQAGAGAQNEDLFVFPVEHVTLGKGERLVVPIAAFEVPYSDVYRLEVEVAPPIEYRHNLHDQRALELERLLRKPKVMHLLRLENASDAPFTTAPALVLHGDRVLAQGHMKYTSRGASTDLEINAAIDVRVEVEEHETGREANVRLNNTRYTRIRLAGTVTMTNSKAEDVEVEVVRRVLGLIDEVGGGGEKAQLDLVNAWNDRPQPTWWTWWSWPWWWYRHNGLGEARWTVKLAPNERVELPASWHYYWN